jgi:peptidoglycan/xylan/chitin deacetylase (PgdA/CDA1 family)
LVDSQARPGAICRYDPVSRALTQVDVRAPVALAVDTTPALDRQEVGARVRVQRRANPGAVWRTTGTSPQQRLIASDLSSPFSGLTHVWPSGDGWVRVQWALRWYDPEGLQSGKAVHEVDWYDCRLAQGPRIIVRVGACPTSLAVAPSILVSHGKRASSMVSLTFDLGGRVSPAMRICRWLEIHAIPATIFPTGVTATQTTQGAQVLALAAARPDLFAVGNHSWDHPRFTGLPPDEIALQLQRTDDALRSVLGHTTRPLFRPPYGSVDEEVLREVGHAGWALTVRWDVVTTDYLPPSQGGPTPDELVEQVLGSARGGSIVILHLGGYSTLEALPGIVAGLEARGLQPVTLPELLGLARADE